MPLIGIVLLPAKGVRVGRCEGRVVRVWRCEGGEV
jgi:hypothetical protein